jgi:hypothetical protein
MQYTNIYFLGIGGIGMSALVRCFKAKNLPSYLGGECISARTRTPVVELLSSPTSQNY